REAVGETTVRVEAGPLEAVVVSPDLKDGVVFNEVCQDMGFLRALSLIRDSIPRLVTRLAENWEDVPVPQRPTARYFIQQFMRHHVVEPGSVLEALNVFPAATGEFVNLLRIRQELQQRGWVATSPEPLALATGQLVLMLDGDISMVLHNLVIPLRLRSWSAETLAKEGRGRFLAQPPSTPTLPRHATCYAYVYREETPQEMIRVGFLMPELSDRTGTLVIHYEQRQLGTQSLTDCGPVDVVLASQSIQPNARWDGVQQGPELNEALARVRQVVAVAAAALVARRPAPHSPLCLAALGWLLSTHALPRILHSSQHAPVLDAPLLEDSLGNRLTPRQVLSSTGELAYVDADRTGSTARGPVVRLTPEELKLFERHVYYTVNVDSQLGAARLLPPPPAPTEGRVLARLEINRRGMRGYLEMVAGLRESSIALTRDEVTLEICNLFGNVPVRGTVDSELFSASAAGGVQMKRQHARHLMPSLDSLAEALGDDAESRAALCEWALFRFEDMPANANAPTLQKFHFQRGDGDRVTLLQLLQQPTIFAAPQPANGVLLMREDDPERVFLRALLGKRFVYLPAKVMPRERAGPLPRLSATAPPLPPTAAPEPEPAPPVGPEPPPEAALPPAPQTEPAPEPSRTLPERPLDAVRELCRRIGLQIDDAFVRTLMLGDMAGDDPAIYQAGTVAINTRNPAVQALVQRHPQQRSAVVYLTSLVITTFNRERGSFNDNDELTAIEALAGWLGSP
ncbi:MAG: hypothetical protein ACYCW6_19915, partial [Candidatus Xenobia bacterium]